MPESYWPFFVVLLIIFGIIFTIAQALERKIVKLCRFLNGRLWDFFFAPIKLLYGCTLKKVFAWLHRLLSPTWYGRLDEKLSMAGGIKTLLFGIASVLFVVIRILCIPDAATELVYNLIFSTAIGAPLSFVMDGFSFTLSTLIGAAFTRYLSMEAMRRSKNLHLAAKLIYGFVFLCAFGLLGTAMGGFFDAVSVFFTDSFHWISTAQGFPNAPDFVNYALMGLLLVVLLIICYLWLVLAVMTLKEYLSNICFGLIPITLFVLVVTLLGALNLANNQWILLAVVLGAVIFGELHRHKLENLTEGQLEQRQQKQQKWNPLLRKKKAPQHTFFGDE